MTPPLVSVESPCKGYVPPWVPARLAPLVERANRRRNMHYAMQCVRDSLARGEAPYASHVFFDRRGLLDDANPLHREVGMRSGAAWTKRADKFAFYLDLGWSRGMQLAYREACERQVPVEVRYIHASPLSTVVRFVRWAWGMY